MRNLIFANGESYHIYNRGADKREVFLDQNDYERFLLAMNLLNDEVDGLMIRWRDFKKSNPSSNPKADLPNLLKLGFRRSPLVEINCFCLNPNHYHFILKQLIKDGIRTFMHKIGTGYTKYFNKKNNRSGVLFQGKFKAIHIDSNEYLLYLSAYVNRNNFIHGYNKENSSWPYSSYLDYVGGRNNALCEKNIVLDQFKGFSDYERFAEEGAEYMKYKKELEKYLLE